LAGLFLTRASGAHLSGPTIAGVFTMAGFGLFGKNVWSIWPIMLGVWAFSRAVRRPLKSYILMALFGTALAPLVTQIAFGLGLAPLPGILFGTLFGAAVGFVLPPLAVYMLRLHQGYNLYNIGLTCGFLGLFITSLIGGVGLDTGLPFIWSEEYSAPLSGALLVYLLSMLAAGLVLTWGRGRQGVRDLWSMMRQAGTLPSDFVELAGPGPALINMGLVGVLGWAYISIVGGTFNGPTIGGVLTMVGFAAFGKHPLNAAPVMAGVYVASRLLIWEPAQAGPLLAALFSTTLAPLSGAFGPLMGLLAGALHLTLVMRTAPWHAGLNLYNNGFAGGLTATLLISVVGWWSSWREEHRARKV
jgi:hypothetical protein